jgi:ketopantoate reductase
VEALAPDDVYDLIMVVMRKNQARAILPTLAANRHTPTILFMMNNAAGQDELIQALGQERVMIGFPLPGGQRMGHVMQVLPANEERDWTLPVGEVDGTVTKRTREVAAVLGTMRGYEVEIRTDMDAWLKYHVAVVLPLACAIYATDLNAARAARTRDALILVVRAVKEAISGLQRANVPVSPDGLQVLKFVPEPLLVLLLVWATGRPEMEVSGIGHARAARDEMQLLGSEMLEFLKAHSVETPTLERLFAYLDPATPPMPDGSCELSLNWRSIWVIGLTKLTFILLLIVAYRRTQKAQCVSDQTVEEAAVEFSKG